MREWTQWSMLRFNEKISLDAFFLSSCPKLIDERVIMGVSQLKYRNKFKNKSKTLQMNYEQAVFIRGNERKAIVKTITDLWWKIRLNFNLHVRWAEFECVKPNKKEY